MVVDAEGVVVPGPTFRHAPVEPFGTPRAAARSGTGQRAQERATSVYSLDVDRLREVSRWLSPYERFWREKLGNLRTWLDEEVF